MNLDFVKGLRVPHAFRDVLSVVAGLILIVAINFYFNYDLSKIPNFYLIKDNPFLMVLLVLSISFFIGRVMKIVAVVYGEILDLLLCIFHIYFKDRRAKIFDYYKKLFNYNFKNNFLKLEEKNNFSDNDILIYLNQYPVIEDEYCRRNYFGIFLELILGGCIILYFLSFNYYLVVIILILTIQLSINTFDISLSNKAMLENKIYEQKIIKNN